MDVIGLCLLVTAHACQSRAEVTGPSVRSGVAGS